jgi:hypothetical protein
MLSVEIVTDPRAHSAFIRVGFVFVAGIIFVVIACMLSFPFGLFAVSFICNQYITNLKTVNNRKNKKRLT